MAILTSKDRKKLNNAAKKKKNTDTGRTAAEKQRKKSVAENAAAEKKKNKSSASKKKATSSSVLNDTEKKEVEEIRRRTQSLRDRNTAVSQRDAYDAARRKSYGERESVKESKTKFGDIVRSDARDLVQTGSVPKRHYDYGLKKYVTEEESRTASRTRDEYDQNVRASYGARNNQRVEGIYTSGNNTTKKKTSHMEETRQYDDALKNAMKLEPDEMYGVKMGSAEDALKEAEDFSDKNKLQNSADNARLYLNAWDRIDPKDHGQAAAYIVYGIGLNDETRNTVMNAFKNASDDDRIAIYQAAIQTVGYTDDVKKMENQLKSGIKWASDNDYRNKVKTAAFVNSTSTPAQNIQKAAEDLKSGAKGQPTARQINLYNSYQKGIEFSKEWAKTHDYSNMDYFIDKYYGANDAFLAGLIDAVGLNVADLTDVDKEGYLLGGIVSPWKGMSDEKSFLDNGVQMLTNIVNSVLSITKLPLKLMTKGLSYIPGMDESLDEASEEALRWSADLQKAIQFYDFKTEYAGADKSKLVKTAGNIESFVVENIPGIALSIVYPAAGTAVFGAQAGGSYGRAAYESGATLDEAISYGTIAALAEVGTEKLFPMAGTFGKSLTERIFSTTAMRTARDKYLYQTTIDMLEKSGFRNSVSGRILKNVLEGGGEATEEMIMEIVNPYLQRAIYDEGAENADLSSILESGLYGLAVAAVLHLPSNVLNVTGDSLGALRRLNYKITAADQKRDTIKIIRNELSLGLITEEEAKKRLEEADINYALAMELYDVATGKGSLRVAEEAAYEEKTESDTRRIYDSAEEAQKSLENEFKGKKIGDEVKGAYFDGEEVREFTAAKTEEGVKYRTADQTEGDIETYRAKAEKIKNAKNETERSGYQLNVKEDIIREVSALSKALGRTIVFDDVAKTYNEDGSANVTRGWFDEKDGSIHVNIHNETPAATVVAHEITHSLEGTKAYAAMQKAVFDYYRSSLGAERKERGALYIEGGKTLESEEDVDYEVMANFVETKLLTDKETINYIVKRNKTFGEKIVNGINRMIQRKIGSKEQKFLAGIRTKWESALDESRKEGDKKGPSEDIAYSETEEIRKKYGEKEPYNRIAGRKYSVGKERDREYMDAVERGDMETAQRMVDQAAKDAGYTERLYHQTDAEFTVFEPRHKGAGSRDNETPYGIFMKTSSANIGLKGNKQMELYAKIQNPLVAYDRRSLRKMIESMSPEYRNLKEEIKNIDKEYGEKFENAKTGWTNYITEWRKNNPDAKRTALYDDPEFQRLFDEEDRIIDEWTEKASNLDERAKEEITRTLTDSGYDGIILSRDEGSFGRSTDAYIALDSSQVKSADAVTYDDSGNVVPLSERFDARDADIRYAFGIEKRSEVLPSTDKWKRGDSFSEIKSVFPTLFELDADEAEKRNPTQIRGTVTTYRKIYDILSSEGFNGKILDASSGLGYGTRAGREEYGYDVDDVEPFPDKNYKPKYTKYADIEENYDVIISNAVLNVIPQDIRDDVVRQMGGLLKPGGRIFINVRGKEVLTNKSNVIIDKDNMEVFVSSTGSYQKGFTNGELKAYLEDALGNNYTVQIDKRFGGIAAVVEKKTKKYSYAREKRKVSAEMGELIKAYNAEMMGVFYERSSADRRKLWDMIHEEMVHAIETGAVRNEKIREIITFAYETGYRMENQEPSAENTWGGGIYVPKEYRGEMDSLGGLRAVNRKMMGSGIYFTYKRKKKGTDIRFGSIDEAYNELLSVNPMMGETTDPSEQVSNIIDFFGGRETKQTLKDMDEEFFETDFVEPYKDDIEKTVEKAFDDISTLARYEMTEKARKEGEEAGEKKGIEKGKKEASKEYAAEQKKEKKQQAKEEKKRVDAQRKADESTMRMHDRLVKEIQKEADRKYAAEEKKKEKERQKMDEETLKEHDRLMKEEERKRKKEVKEELNKQAKEYKEAQKAERKSYEEIIKGQEKQKKKLEKEMDQQERQKKREEDSKRDKDRRGERIQLAQQEAKRRREKPQPGSTKSMYLNNKNVRKLCFEFRTDVISRLVEMGLFTDTNGEVVIDNNGMEVAWKTTYGKWEASNKKNEYTPYWGLTTLAEKEGIDADTFYTIYSKLVKMKEQGSTEGKNPKKRIVEYIESLDLTAKQKMFLYFDAAKYAYSKRPGTGNTKPFTDGGTVTEPKGNIRGIMIRLLDDITFDMYRNANMAPTLLQSEESRQIRQKDITDFLDAVFGEETSEQKDQFAAYFMGIIEDLSSQIESARMIAMSNLLIDKPQEKNSLRMNIVRSYRQTKRQFVAEGEAYERMSRKLKDPLYAAYYYGAKKYTAVANEMIYGKGQRGMDGKKQGKSLYQIFEPIFKADEKNKNNEKMKLLTLFVNCRHDMYRLMNGKGYTGYTVEECKDIVERISEKYPEIVKAGDEIADYGRNLLRMCVESGRLSEEDYQYYTIKYPYYVPAFRYVERTYYDREGKVVRRDKDVIRKAKGGTQPDVLPLFDQMVNKTNEIVKVCKKNQLAGRLANAHRLGATEYIADVRLTEAEERKKKKAEREQKKKEKQVKKNGGVVEKNLVSEEETPMEDMIDAIGEEEENLEDIIPWYSNGVKYEIEVADEGILIGWDKLSPIKNEKDWLKVLRKFNDFRRGVLTQYNPTFWFTNGIKDLQDLFLYYPHAQRIPKYYAIAIKTMFAGNVTGLKKGIDKRRGKQTDEERKNEAMLQEYLAYGMAESSIFQYDETEGGRRKKRTKIKGALRKPLDLFDGLNFSVEQLPRFAVYLETIDRLEKQRKKGGNEYTDEEIKTIAVYNASDATVNFGRSGTVVKNLNTYGCTFLNAGVQGTSKFVRMFTQVKDGNVKTIAFRALGLGVKLSIFGLSPRILSDIFYGDDDDDKGWMQELRELFFGNDAAKVQKEYAEMADYQKLNYYLIYAKGTWIRIPRGRVAAFVRSFEFNGTKVSEDEMDALDLVIAQMDMASDTILFGNPITNNILGPCIEVWNNKDNWGREIVSEYEDKGEGFHYLEYDEDTSDLAIKLAEFGHYLTGTRFGKENSRLLDFSPKKLDHLISQYLGSYSNLIVPFLSGDQTLSEKGMDAVMSLAKKFYVDPTLSNRLAGDYYDLKEEYTNIANAHDGDSPYAVVDYVFKDYNEQLKVKREMIQTITADPNMTRKQKLDRVSEIRAEMNELYRQGIADAKDLLGYADANYFGKEGNREVYEDWLDLTKDSDWKLSTMSDSAQAMYNEISSTGVTTDNFVKAYNFFGNLTGDKDENGKTIRNSKRDKFVTYLNSLPATAEQKKEMYYSIGGYSRNKEAPTFADGEYKQPVLTDMTSPLASGGRISSGYGQRVCPFHGEEFHAAVDIAAPAGTAIGSALSGTVTMAAYSGGFGNTVEVTSVDANGNTIVTKYNHMSELGVEVGDVIGQGVQVGKVGSTGSSTGPHLDFRLKINGEWVDPEQYLDLESAGVVNSTGYSAKAASGGSASGGYASSGGGGSKSSGSKSGGGSSGGRRSSGTATASTGSRRSSTGSGSSGGSSGGVTLPTASQASAITGRSTKATTYSQGGVTLPTAKDLARSRGTISSTASAKSTQRTGRSKGSFWNENILG